MIILLLKNLITTAKGPMYTSTVLKFCGHLGDYQTSVQCTWSFLPNFLEQNLSKDERDRLSKLSTLWRCSKFSKCPFVVIKD